MQWVGREKAQAVGRVRALCYSPATKDIPEYQNRLVDDGRVTADDILLATRDGQDVATATSYSQVMWVRGAPVPCQGVAWVGTIKSARRSDGIASSLMKQVLLKGRERGQVVSALMPFRASFYEHFGYGLVERRVTWTIPLAILPHGRSDGFEIINGADESRRACRQRMVQSGHCDIERTPGTWENFARQEDDGYVVADRAADGSTRSWAAWEQQKTPSGKDLIVVEDLAWDSPQSLRRQLGFLSTMRDQYWGVSITLPVDLPLNRLLHETQVPHRAVNHETAEAKLSTRMQVRILDHQRLLEAMHLPASSRGAVVVAVRETEGTVSQFRIEFDSGHASVTPTSAAPDLECADRDWASIALGDVRAADLVHYGHVKCHNPDALALLDLFTAGPAPFCNEYF